MAFMTSEQVLLSATKDREVIEWLIAIVRSIDADRARLEKIIEQLPKTADGVTVVPGMMLWTLDCANPKGFGGRVLDCDFRDWSKWYSTREAMDAALA
jgi:hypothetical protein